MIFLFTEILTKFQTYESYRQDDPDDPGSPFNWNNDDGSTPWAWSGRPVSSKDLFAFMVRDKDGNFQMSTGSADATDKRLIICAFYDRTYGIY